MSNLISSVFHRLKSSKLFYLCLAGAFLLSVFIMLNSCRVALLLAADGWSSKTLDDCYFDIIPFMGFVCSLFCSLFVGVEYSNGTMRNKVVVGQTRTSIYFSFFTVNLAASELFTLVGVIGGLVGIPVLGTFNMGIKGAVIYILLAMLIAAAWAGIFTFISMLVTDRAICAVTSILLFLILLITASMMYNALCEPEMISGAILTANGIEMSDPEPNPSYIGGFMRDVYTFIVRATPVGQGILLANVEMETPVFCAVSSVIITIITTVFGSAFFRKKDLK